jgi:ribosomal protein L18
MRKRRHERVRKKLSGTSERPRLNVYRSLSQIYVQVINDEAGKTLVSVSSLESDVKSQLKGKNKTEQAKVMIAGDGERFANGWGWKPGLKGERYCETRFPRPQRRAG